MGAEFSKIESAEFVIDQRRYRVTLYGHGRMDLRRVRISWSSDLADPEAIFTDCMSFYTTKSDLTRAVTLLSQFLEIPNFPARMPC